jgi:hypothetical protein
MSFDHDFNLFWKLTSCSNVCANKPYSDLVLKNQKKVAVASILSKNFRRYCRPVFFSGDAKVSAFIYPTNYFSNKKGENLDPRMFLRTVCFIGTANVQPKFIP